jgi:hypothetical protein
MRLTLPSSEGIAAHPTPAAHTFREPHSSASPGAKMVTLRVCSSMDVGRSPAALALLLGLLLPAPTAAQVAAQAAPTGWMWAMNITVDSGRGSPQETSIRFQIADRHQRIDILKTPAAPEVASGMYMLMDATDSTMTTVMPAMNTAMVMNPRGMFATGLPTPRWTVKALKKSEVADLGAGERLLGHDTHRFRVTQLATMTLSMLGQTCDKEMNVVSELWTATDIDGDAFEKSMASMTEGLVGSPAVNELKSMTRNYPKGFALRVIAKQVEPAEDGKPGTIATTMETTEIAHAPIDEAAFKVPDGYHTMDMRGMAKEPGTMEAAMQTMNNTMMKRLCGAGTP